MSQNNSGIYLRKATDDDIDMLFEWVNDELTRMNSFNEDKISYDEHIAWFKEISEDNNRYQLILMDGVTPVGQIRLSILDDVAEIGYSVAKVYRGYGYGKKILALALMYIKENLPRVKNVIGQVKPSNVASYKAFVDNGFEEKYKSLEINVSDWNRETLLETICPKKRTNGGVLFLTNNINTLDLFDWISEKTFCDIYSDELTRDIVAYYKPSLIVSFNYSHIVKADVIELVDHRIINMHISYLPWNRGSNPNFWSFIDNTPKGVTIHKMESGLDTGDIICQKEIHFDEERETLKTSYDTLLYEIKELFKAHWDELMRGTYKALPQVGEGSYHTVEDYKKYKDMVRYDVVIKEIIRQVYSFEGY